MGIDQIDNYLRRLKSTEEWVYLDDFYELYSSVSNEDLRVIFASIQTNLNNWIKTINSDIKTSYNEDGIIQYTGGYFHAQDSRDYLTLLEKIDSLKSHLHGTSYEFRFCDTYDDFIRKTRRFVVKSGGSTIPDNFSPTEIIDLEPAIFMVQTISISHENKKYTTSLKNIGEGSYATVFSFEDSEYEFKVALKRAKKELDNKELARFKQEFEILKSLSSPYIVSVYKYDETSNEYTMEYLDETLYKYILRHNDQLSLQERKGIIIQICRGLNYIHSKNLLHRDLSLTNIFVKHYEDINVIKIADFGLVKVQESNLTSFQSEIKGSLNDPDLINVGFANYEMCHEIYALTRICYFVLTGRTNISKQKPGTVKDIWLKGTNTDRAKRYEAVDELLEAIKCVGENDI